jgi:hypothetical protein
MSETTRIFKTMIALGILVLLVNSLAESGLPGAPSAFADWGAIQEHIETGVQWPEFFNPFEADTSSFTLIPIDNSTPPNPPLSTTGCVQYWRCVHDDDGTDSYATIDDNSLGGDTLDIEVRIGDLPGDARTVDSMTYVIVCRNVGPYIEHRGVAMNVNEGLNSPTAFLPCSSEFFTLYTFSIPFPIINGPTWDQISGADNFVASLDDSGLGIVVDITFMAIQVDSHEDRGGTCATDPFGNMGCQIARFIDTLGRGILFFINGIMWIATSIAAVAIFTGTITVVFFSAIINTAIFFLALPGAPPIVQAIVAIVFLALVVALLIDFIRIIQGFIP